MCADEGATLVRDLAPCFVDSKRWINYRSRDLNTCSWEPSSSCPEARTTVPHCWLTTVPSKVVWWAHAIMIRTPWYHVTFFPVNILKILKHSLQQSKKIIETCLLKCVLSRFLVWPFQDGLHTNVWLETQNFWRYCYACSTKETCPQFLVILKTCLRLTRKSWRYVSLVLHAYLFSVVGLNISLDQFKSYW